MSTFKQMFVAVALAGSSLAAVSGPIGSALGSLGLGGVLSDTTSTLTGTLGSVTGVQLLDADVLSPATGEAAIDVDLLTSKSLLGLELADREVLELGSSLEGSDLSNTALDGLSSGLNTTVQSLLGADGFVTEAVKGLGDGLQDGAAQLTDALGADQISEATAPLDVVNVSVGNLDIGSNSANTLADVDVLNTDRGTQGDIGVAVISDGAAGNGDVAGISVINDGNSGQGGLVGASVIGDGSSGRGGVAGIAAIAGDNSGNGGVAGVGALVGDNSGSSDTIGAAVLGGDNSGNGELIGGAVLAGANSGNSSGIGASVLNSNGSDGNGNDGLTPGNPGLNPVDLVGFDLETRQAVAERLAMVCAADSDGDGICDDQDECPETPEGAAVLSNGCHLEEGKPLVLNGVRFAFNSAQLTQASAYELVRAIQLLKSDDSLRIQIAGHTDNWGTDSYNNQLSLDRANAVRKVLVDNGIDPSRLEIVGYGRSRPVAANNREDGSDDPYGRAANRRVEFQLLNNEDQQYSGL